MNKPKQKRKRDKFPPASIPPLDSRTLMKGGLLCAKNARRYIVDARLMWSRGRYSSVIVLASYALEEMGKAKILLDAAVQAYPNGKREWGTLRKDLGDHIPKMKQGLGSRMLSVPQLMPLFESLHKETSKERIQELNDAINAGIAEAQEERPYEPFDKRMGALYVDYSDGEWTDPTQSEAIDAMNLLDWAEASFNETIWGPMTNEHIAIKYVTLLLSPEVAAIHPIQLTWPRRYRPWPVNVPMPDKPA